MKTFQASLTLLSFCICMSSAANVAKRDADLSEKIATVGTKELFAASKGENPEKTWGSALSECHKLGLRIASIESAEENEAVTKFLQERAKTKSDVVRAWLAGTDFFTEGKWYWVGSKKPFSYTNWGDNEPIHSTSNNCVLIVATPDTDASASNGKWNAVSCDPEVTGIPICQTNA